MASDEPRSSAGGLAAFPRRKKALRCGPFRLEELAERFGTPLYLYSMDFIRERFRQVQTAFASVDPLLAYSVKANGNLALLNRLLALHGAGHVAECDNLRLGELFVIAAVRTVRWHLHNFRI